MAKKDDDSVGTVSGFQSGRPYPNAPLTADDFAALLNNPELPPQNQSAPSQEQLNPHLFPARLP